MKPDTFSPLPVLTFAAVIAGLAFMVWWLINRQRNKPGDAPAE